MHYLCQIVYGDDHPLDSQPTRKDIVVVGLSDGPVYSLRLSKKMSYINTFYHKEPILDISKPLPQYRGYADVLISSEVFEHVIGSSKDAFSGAYFILKRGGWLLFSAPFINIGDSKEHYPGLVSYTPRKDAIGKWVVDLRFEDGRRETDWKPKFHGGPGLTLELRLFSRKRILAELAEAGFVNIVVHDEEKPQYGINWGPPSRIITAQKLA